MPEEDEYDERELSWLMAVDHLDAATSQARYRLTFNPLIMPFMRELEKGFSRFSLKDCTGLASTNQIRLYEDLCLFRETGWWKTTLQDFAIRYQLSPSSTSRPAEFKRYFLDNAVKQINGNTPLLISYTAEGNTFTFTIVDKLKAAKLCGAVAAAAGEE